MMVTRALNKHFLAPDAPSLASPGRPVSAPPPGAHGVARSHEHPWSTVHP
jgi:hypothetical protein